MLGKRILALAAAAAVVALGGCERDSLQRNFGLTREAPDEFVVTTRAPLSMPPDFALRPPQPGASRPQEAALSQQAEAALVPQAVGDTTAPASLSPGQDALLAAAGPPAPADVRQQVNAEAAKEASSGSLTDELMFWKTPAPPGTLVDPAKEAQRLKENAALGQSPDAGQTPIIQKQQKTFLDTLF